MSGYILSLGTFSSTKNNKEGCGCGCVRGVRVRVTSQYSKCSSSKNRKSRLTNIQGDREFHMLPEYILTLMRVPSLFLNLFLARKYDSKRTCLEL
jgi:hypothetical protein